MRYYSRAFNLLKDCSVSVSISAGRKKGGSIPAAVHEGGAARLSSCYVLHRDVPALNYVAQHDIGLELCTSEHLNRYTRDVTSFSPSILRLYYDTHCRVCLCSIAHTISGCTLSDVFYKAVEHNNFSAADLITLMSYPCKSAFLDYTL